MHRRIFFHYNKRKDKKVGEVCTVGYFFIIIRERREKEEETEKEEEKEEETERKGRGRGGTLLYDVKELFNL
jgi:hypothetical protein